MRFGLIRPVAEPWSQPLPVLGQPVRQLRLGEFVISPVSAGCCDNQRGNSICENIGDGGRKAVASLGFPKSKTKTRQGELPKSGM